MSLSNFTVLSDVELSSTDEPQSWNANQETRASVQEEGAATHITFDSERLELGIDHIARTSGLDELRPSVRSTLLAGLLDSSMDGIMAFDSRRSATGQIVDFEWIVVNSVAERMLGRESIDLLGQCLLELVPGDADNGLFDRYVDVVETGEPFTTEHHDRHEGRDRWFSTTAVRLDDGFAVTFRDVTDQRRAFAALAHQKHHDSLTGLANATLLEDRISHALQGLERRSEHVGVVAVEVDPIGRVADVVGHQATNEMLIEVARRLQDATRDGDTVARVDGHRFVVLCPHLDDPNDVRLVAQLLTAAFSDPITIGEEVYHASARIGAATSEASSAEPVALIRDAETAAHRAVTEARDRVNGALTIGDFDDRRRAAEADRLSRQVEISDAIANGEFDVHYQPVHDAESHGIVGLEALVRWQHPTEGLLTPASFVSDAEELGLIVQLGDFVRLTALSHLRSWVDTLGVDHAPVVAVNASATELGLVGYAKRVTADLERADIAAEHFCIEVNETSLIRDPVVAGTTLRSLSDHGVKIALDDFGNGHSAHDLIRRFPIDVVKIDRSFTADIEHDWTDRTIVAAVLDLAHSLGQVTVAEGIETGDQLDVVVGLGAHRVQGHHFSRPVPFDQVTAELSRHR